MEPLHLNAKNWDVGPSGTCRSEVCIGIGPKSQDVRLKSWISCCKRAIQVPLYVCRNVFFFEDQSSHSSRALSHHNAFNTVWMMSFLFHYSDPHSVLSARSQSRLCHQYWKAGGRRGTERGKVAFWFLFFFLLRLIFVFICRFQLALLV